MKQTGIATQPENFIARNDPNDKIPQAIQKLPPRNTITINAANIICPNTSAPCCRLFINSEFIIMPIVQTEQRIMQ